MDTYDSFEELPDDVQTDLLTWFNGKADWRVELSLLSLFNRGLFEAWDCPECGTRCYKAKPDDWDWCSSEINKQVDYRSFPIGDKYHPDYAERMCNTCRMTKQGYRAIVINRGY